MIRVTPKIQKCSSLSGLAAFYLCSLNPFKSELRVLYSEGLLGPKRTQRSTGLFQWSVYFFTGAQLMNIASLACRRAWAYFIQGPNGMRLASGMVERAMARQKWFCD
ncbi:MAG: hypothetical protein JWR26_2431 [Pedosphaera sp.]|nr:hypothetical protein [Pedosphaera sp.]